MKKWIFLLFPLSIYASCSTTEISCPCYSGGFYGGGAWLYLQPMPSDGDLEQGSFLTLTVDPANLNAQMLEIKPNYQNALNVNLGYQFGCTNQCLDLDYTYLRATDSNSKSISELNQLIQNFLGASYSSSKANSEHKVHHLDFTYGLDFIVDCCFDLHPFFGVGFADIHRDFDVFYEDLVLNPTASSLKGKERSKYWGVGPVFGADFSWPLFNYLKLHGHFEAGFLFGKTKSKLDSESFRDNLFTDFFAKDRENRTVTYLNTEVALFFAQPFYCDRFQLELEVGYRVDYYFKPINRINPFNGYVNNANTFPVNQPSNLGFHGPYIMVSIAPGLPCLGAPFLCNPLPGCSDSALYFHFISSWLKPHPTKDDLTYGNLVVGNKEKKQKVTPDTTWLGVYELGIQFCTSYDIQAKYFHLGTQDRASTNAKENEGILSLNASGPAFVEFSNAKSRVKYEIDQIDVTLGKRMQIFCPFGLRGFFGVRYLDLKRKINNTFVGGEPPVITQEKFPRLKSHFDGIGPIFGFEPNFDLFWNFAIVGNIDVALLIGDIKSTLDQQNIGLAGLSSNTLRMPKTPSIIPVLDVKGGVGYNACLSCFQIHLEGGYQYTSYYRGVNLMFPTLLTGLEQNNSNLRLTGPYLDVGLDICF